MRVLCSAVLGIEAIVVFLATSLAASNGSVSNTTARVGGRPVPHGGAVPRDRHPAASVGTDAGWILQAVVLATSLVVGWSMVFVGGVFVVLWWLAIHNGSRVDAMRAQAGSGD